MPFVSVRLAAKCALASVVTVTLAASARQAPEQPPQFRSGVDLVTLDLTATGPDGTPIPDLRADEIKITIRDRPRRIKSFEFVEVAPLRRSANPKVSGPGPTTGARAVATSAGAGQGRNIFVVVLHEHIRTGNERVAMQAVRWMVDRLEPRDRVAVVTMPFGRVEVDLTTDHEQVKKQLGKLVGHASPRIPVATGATTSSEAIDLLEFLKSIIPLHGPKTILLISEGFQSGDGPFEKTGRGDTSAPLLLDRTETSPTAPLLNSLTALQPDIRDIRTAAAAARAQFYVIQAHNFPIDPAFKDFAYEGLDTDPYKDLSRQTSELAGFATLVGGRFVQLSGASKPIFERIVRETSGYYAVAFATEPEDRDGKASSVEVSTTRKGVILHARRTFVDPRAAANQR